MLRFQEVYQLAIAATCTVGSLSALARDGGGPCTSAKCRTNVRTLMVQGGSGSGTLKTATQDKIKMSVLAGSFRLLSFSTGASSLLAIGAAGYYSPIKFSVAGVDREGINTGAGIALSFMRLAKKRGLFAQLSLGATYLPYNSLALKTKSATEVNGSKTTTVSVVNYTGATGVAVDLGLIRYYGSWPFGSKHVLSYGFNFGYVSQSYNARSEQGYSQTAERITTFKAQSAVAYGFNYMYGTLGLGFDI